MATSDLSSRIAAMLAVIRKFESNGDYLSLYGGGHFSDFSRHPRVRVPIDLPGYEGQFSTAAGAYQITYPTYCEFAQPAGITDFAPDSQDAIATAILKACGAVQCLAMDQIDAAFVAASKRWASLPGSTANQHPKSAEAARDAYKAMLA